LRVTIHARIAIVRLDRKTGSRKVTDGLAARPTALTFDEQCMYVVDAATRSLVRVPR